MDMDTDVDVKRPAVVTGWGPEVAAELCRAQEVGMWKQVWAFFKCRGPVLGPYTTPFCRVRSQTYKWSLQAASRIASGQSS